MRINKLLSNMGYCSRKEATRWIDDKRVQVNGSICIPGQWVTEEDSILVDGEAVMEKERIYLAFNKPVGIVCTAEKSVDNNIIDFVNYGDYIFPVGRLDKESQGLILLTNDGGLANKILESGNGHDKEYVVELDREFDDSFITGMSEGVDILNVRTKACRVFRLNSNTFGIVLTQGLNKQIRRMSKAFGYDVVRLERIRIMNIMLNGIPEGEWRKLTEAEVEWLKNC